MPPAVLPDGMEKKPCLPSVFPYSLNNVTGDAPHPSNPSNLNGHNSAAPFLPDFIFSSRLETILPHANDWLALAFIIAYGIYAWTLIRNTPVLRKKYRLSLILAITAPFLIGPIFKYLLLVPMPTEGLVVAAMDAIWYFEF